MLNAPSTIAVLGIFISLLCSPSIVASDRLLDRLFLPSSLTGPESLAFDSIGGGPYTGVSDGRILKYENPNSGFVEFAHISPDRNKTICDGISDFSSLQETCGRPLGLSFNHQTGDLYIADAYFGLMKVAYDGGAATQLVADAQGNPFGFLAGLDVDPETGIVYFSEASSVLKISDLHKLFNSTDRSGSLFSYDPTTNQISLLLSDLAVAAGVAVSNNGSFVLVSEYMGNRIQRFWLTGPNANTSDVFLQLPGRPNNIKRNSKNEFWVAMNYPFGTPPPPIPPVLPLALRVNGEGVLLEAVSLVEEFGTESVTEVQELNGTLYASSLHVSYVNMLKL
ncbi:protein STRICTOSIDINE SYNTHASE-LIKE 12-like [Gastrolobium bilobum]|uniref:protein STRICTOSIDINE SYNTHASE-LIKE 12-like n=1 Tax=Gastrolobium bilobum TaxID=150636 RepID=UPI002AB2C1F1|nr:protein STRICTOSIDINE SYNTHASE-LIKE 12-like [Gastrolobium bilobum]